MKILSIETSCDETSAAIVEKEKDTQIKVISHVTASSMTLHGTTGGIIPENAAREQVKWIMRVITQCLLQSKNKKTKNELSEAHTILKEVDGIAVTYGPGLIGSLIIGVETAKTLAFILKKPLIPVNHLLAHISANFIQSPRSPFPLSPFPCIGLIVSGGHTDLLYFTSIKKYQWLGGTRDDAAGEAFDKVGRLLNLSYPAGPEIEKRALNVKKITLSFTSPLLNSNDYDFSFSGLKAQVMRFVQKEKNINEVLKNEICYAAQKAIIDILISKTLKAAKEFNCSTILLGGGVSANQTLKAQFNEKIMHQSHTIQLFSPVAPYCTDNAAMIGAHALLDPNPVNWREVKAEPELYFT